LQVAHDVLGSSGYKETYICSHCTINYNKLAVLFLQTENTGTLLECRRFCKLFRATLYRRLLRFADMGTTEPNAKLDKTLQLSRRLAKRKLVSASLATFSLSLLFIVAFGKSACENVMTKFWLQDEGLSGISGPMRFFIYVTLLILMETSPWPRPPPGNSPLQAAQLWEKHPPSYRDFEPAIGYLVPLNWINSHRLRTLGNITEFGYLMSAVGVGGQIGPVVAGLGTFFLCGVSQHFVYMTHRWHVPMYTTLSLILSSGNDNWSLDAVFWNTFGDSYWFKPPPSTSIFYSTLGPKLVLVFSISTLFFGGITKLLNSGLAWMDGETLNYYITYQGYGKVEWLNKFLSKHPAVCTLLSIGSVAFELGSVLVIFSHPFSYSIRTVTLLGAIGFHFGIWLLMLPNFLPQSICYLIIMPWPTRSSLGQQ